MDDLERMLNWESLQYIFIAIIPIIVGVVLFLLKNRYCKNKDNIKTIIYNYAISLSIISIGLICFYLEVRLLSSMLLRLRTQTTEMIFDTYWFATAPLVSSFLVSTFIFFLTIKEIKTGKINKLNKGTI